MAIVGGIVLLVVSVLLRGWVLSILWGWFVVPLGVMTITIPLALGLSALISMFTVSTSEERELRKFSESVAASIVVSLGMLGLGAIYHAFM